MWNGYAATLVDVQGAKKNRIEHTRDKIAERSALLDEARWRGLSSLPDDYPVTNADLDGTAAAQGVEIRRGDLVIVRTRHQERCRAAGDWTGCADGDAPGLAFGTAYCIRKHDIATKLGDRWSKIGVKRGLSDRLRILRNGRDKVARAKAFMRQHRVFHQGRRDRDRVLRPEGIGQLCRINKPMAEVRRPRRAAPSVIEPAVRCCSSTLAGALSLMRTKLRGNYDAFPVAITSATRVDWHCYISIISSVMCCKPLCDLSRHIRNSPNVAPTDHGPNRTCPAIDRSG